MPSPDAADALVLSAVVISTLMGTSSTSTSVSLTAMLHCVAVLATIAVSLILPAQLAGSLVVPSPGPHLDKHTNTVLESLHRRRLFILAIMAISPFVASRAIEFVDQALAPEFEARYLSVNPGLFLVAAVLRTAIA